ncbi:MAG: helix-turn-helix transcriptional regulator [Chloroflexota bacterium]|nr:helix-turn-helix transcriptional regulator [Chloroflexota bacterium]
MDLAERSATSRSLVSTLERGRVRQLRVSTVVQIAEAVGIPLGWDVVWRRTELAEMRDAHHAALQNAVKRSLERSGWHVRAEVSFNRYGERGRVDLLAYEPVSRVILVVEIKTAFVDAQELLGSLHVKQRLAREMAREIGWRADGVVPAIVFPSNTTIRRRVAAHASLFRGFGLRGVHALAWLRRPSGTPDGVLLFSSVPKAASGRISHSRDRRVRIARGCASVRGPRELSG